MTTSDDAVLLSLKEMDVRYGRKLVLNYQSWEFSHGHVVTFKPDQDATTRREIMHRAFDLARRQVVEDIKATLSEIIGVTGDGNLRLEALQRSLQ